MADRLDSSRADFVKDLVRSIVADAMGEIASGAVERIKDSLSTDYPPSSNRGEYAHRRTGRLQAGIGHEPSEEGGRVSVRFVSEAPYSGTLEGALERLVLSPTHAELTETLVNDVAQALRERF